LHVNEGRPLIIAVSGRVEVTDWEEVKDVENFTFNLYRSMIEKLRGFGKLLFEDGTGCVFEIGCQLTSIVSKGYFLLGVSNFSIQVIFLVEDLLYPFRRPEIIQKDLQKNVNRLKDLVQSLIPEKYKRIIELNIVDARWLEVPFSLDVLCSIPDR